MSQMLVADIVAKILRREGIRFITGFPENRILDSVVDVGIRPVIARNERVALNIADGLSRMTGGQEVGVVAVQDGPGAEAVFPAVAQAYGDGSPVLVLAAAYDRPMQGYAPNFSGRASYAPITKSCYQARTAGEICGVFRRAFSDLRNGPRGPVLVEIPRDLLYEQVEGTELNYGKTVEFKCVADDQDVERVLDALVTAQSPVIIAGQGVLYGDACSRLVSLAEVLGIPVMTTLNGKSSFPEDHALALGTGAKSRPDTVAEFLNTADFVLGVGTSFTRSEYITPVPSGKRMGQITHSPSDIGKCYAVDVGAVGDVSIVLDQLLACAQRIPSREGRANEIAKRIASCKKRFLEEWQARLTSDEVPISPYRLVWELNRAVDKSCTGVTHDSGNPRDQLVPFYEAIIPHGYTGWGKTTHLGTGLGLALGASLARPDWVSVNVMGDAAFGHTGLDIETGVREALPVFTVVLNNGVMGGYRRFMPRASSSFGSNKISGDYRAIAEALGAYAESVRDPNELKSAINRCLESVKQRRSSVLEVFTAEEPNFPVG